MPLSQGIPTMCSTLSQKYMKILSNTLLLLQFEFLNWALFSAVEAWEPKKHIFQRFFLNQWVLFAHNFSTSNYDSLVTDFHGSWHQCLLLVINSLLWFSSCQNTSNIPSREPRKVSDSWNLYSRTTNSRYLRFASMNTWFSSQLCTIRDTSDTNVKDMGACLPFHWLTKKISTDLGSHFVQDPKSWDFINS